MTHHERRFAAVVFGLVGGTATLVGLLVVCDEAIGAIGVVAAYATLALVPVALRCVRALLARRATLVHVRAAVAGGRTDAPAVRRDDAGRVLAAGAAAPARQTFG